MLIFYLSEVVIRLFEEEREGVCHLHENIEMRNCNVDKYRSRFSVVS